MSASNRWLIPSSDRHLKLENDGHLEIQFLGIGSAFASEHFQSNIVVVKGKTHLMIDLGTLAPLALRDGGRSVMDIENLLVTHSHADHIGGIEEWCLKARYTSPATKGIKSGEYKPNLFIPADYLNTLWDASLRGGLEHSEETLLGKRLSLADYVNIHLAPYATGYGRPVYEQKIGTGTDTIDIKMMRTNHLPDSSKSWQTAFFSVGMLIDDRVFITGDTMFDRELVEVFGSMAEVIFHDCQDFTGGVHASYDELVGLPAKFKEKMFLYHLPDGITSQHTPSDDGFLDWTVPYHQGTYILS